MNGLIKTLFFNKIKIKTFFITRLCESEIEEKVFLKSGSQSIEISRDHGMICLDPFCVAAWVDNNNVNSIDPKTARIVFTRKNILNASVEVILTGKIPTKTGILLLYKIEKVKNYQLSVVHRLLLFSYLLRSGKNTFYSRKVISALYSYPRSIIIVSYKDDQYYNIFPMDIHGYLQKDGLYILGLRTTNITLDKILAAGKVVVCDTDAVDINTVYNLGKHSSKAPTPLEELSFGTSESDVFRFPVPDFTGSYKEIEIIHHQKMGYHMLMIGKVIHIKETRSRHSSLYHVGFLQFQKSNYSAIDGLF